MSIQDPPILIYGTNWCPDCTRVLKFMDANNIVYLWININKEPSARAIVEKINKGNRSVPTIIWPDGSFLVEPSIKQLSNKLGL